MRETAEALTERIQQLTTEQLLAVDQFIESLQSGDEHSMLLRAAARQSEPAFGFVWSNSEDDVYDSL